MSSTVTTRIAELEVALQAGHAYIADLEARNAELVSALEQLLYMQPDIPDSNCSCHICAPCGDCVEYAGIREASDDAQEALAKQVRIDELEAQLKCPIGLDDNPMFCSAGTCKTCQGLKIGMEARKFVVDLSNMDGSTLAYVSDPVRHYVNSCLDECRRRILAAGGECV